MNNKRKSATIYVNAKTKKENLRCMKKSIQIVSKYDFELFFILRWYHGKWQES